MPWYLIDNIARDSLMLRIPGVDPQRLTTAGLSLGGWQAFWTGALDTRVSRVAMAGILLPLELMESSVKNHSCQEIPGLSVAFLNPWLDLKSRYQIGEVPASSMLLTSPDISALVFPRTLISTAGHGGMIGGLWFPGDPAYSSINGMAPAVSDMALRFGGSFTYKPFIGVHEWYLPLDPSLAASPVPRLPPLARSG